MTRSRALSSAASILAWATAIPLATGCAGMNSLGSSPSPTTPPASIADTRSSISTPGNLRATSGELRVVPLAWDPLFVGEVSGYVIERARSREGPYQRVAELSGRTSTTWLDQSGLRKHSTQRDDEWAPGDKETLYYRVRALGPDGRTSPASETVAATTAPAPIAPSDLRAFSHQPRRIPLSWQASPNPNAIGYEIYRSPSAAGPFEAIASARGRFETLYVDEPLGDLRVLYYRVSTVNAAGGEGAPSPAVRAVTKAEPLPPYGLELVEKRLGSHRLGWMASVEDDLVEYRLTRRLDDASGTERVTSIGPDQTHVLDVDVPADTPVSYTLVAVDRDGLYSAASTRLSVDSASYDLDARSGSEGVTLSWDPHATEGWVAADVERRGVLGFHKVAAQQRPPWTDADIESGRVYQYRLRLRRADGTEAPVSRSVAVHVP